MNVIYITRMATDKFLVLSDPSGGLSCPLAKQYTDFIHVVEKEGRKMVSSFRF